MWSNKLHRFVTLLFAFLILSSGCRSELETVVSPTPPAAAIATKVPTTAVPPTAAPPTPTFTPSPTPTPHLNLSPENAAAVVQLKQFGRGTINNLSWSLDGTTLAVATTTGLDYYDAKTLTLLSTLSSQQPLSLAAISPQGDTLVVTSEGDFTVVELWDRTSGQSLFRLNGGAFMNFGADGKTVVVWAGSNYSNAATLYWQNLATGEVDRMLELSQPPLAYSPGADYFIDFADPGEWRHIRLLDGLTGEAKQTYELPTHGGTVAISPDGKWLAASSADYAVRLWEVNSGELRHVLSGHSNWVENVVFTADGRFLATGSSLDGSTRLWDTDTGELRHLLPGGRQLGFDSDSEEMAIINWDRIQFYNVTTGQLERTLEKYSSRVEGIAFSPDSKLLAATGGNGQEIRLWDITTGELLQSIAGEGFLSTVAFSPDGKILVWGELDSPYRIQLYDLAANRPLKTLTGHHEGLYSIFFSPDGELMATTTWNREGIFWDTQSWERVFSQPVNFHVAYHPNGRMVAMEKNDGLGSASVEIWDLSSWERLHTYPIAGHIHGFTPEGLLLAAQYCCDDNIGAGLMDIDTGQFLRSIDGVCGRAALSPNGRLLAGCSSYGGGNAILLWDVATGHQLHELLGHTSLFKTAFSPDGRLLASAGGDGTIRLWGLPAGTP